MRTYRRLFLSLVFFAGAILLGSCTAVTNPGQYEFGATCSGSDPSNLRVELFGFEAYDEELIEVQVARGDDFLMRAVFEGIDEEGTGFANGDNAFSLCVTFPEVTEEPGVYTVRTFVDLNGNGDFDSPAEPGWFDSVDDGYALVEGDESPSGFDAIAEGVPVGNLVLDVEQMSPHVSRPDQPIQHFAVMVLDSEQVVVGFARLPEIATPDFRISIPGILRPAETYSLELYADFTKNGLYDPPHSPLLPTDDHSWIHPFTSEDSGDTEVTFVHNPDFVPLESFLP